MLVVLWSPDLLLCVCVCEGVCVCVRVCGVCTLMYYVTLLYEEMAQE